MQKGGPFWPFGALQRAFEGQKREELGHFWQFGGEAEGVTMKRIPFGGLKPSVCFWGGCFGLPCFVEMRAIPFGGLT